MTSTPGPGPGVEERLPRPVNFHLPEDAGAAGGSPPLQPHASSVPDIDPASSHDHAEQPVRDQAALPGRPPSPLRSGIGVLSVASQASRFLLGSAAHMDTAPQAAAHNHRTGGVWSLGGLAVYSLAPVYCWRCYMCTQTRSTRKFARMSVTAVMVTNCRLVCRGRRR